MARLYHGQVGFVSLDGILSKAFEIRRGTKQGDPLSPALFNAVLEDGLRKIKSKWHKKSSEYAIAVGETGADILTNLRFADDLLLMASSKKQIKEILEDLVASAGGVGLEIHVGKTKVLTKEDTNKSSSLRIDGGKDVKMLQGNASTESLGRK